MAAKLTANAILAMNNGDVDLRPLVQVLDIKQIATVKTVQERYQMVLSDGAFMQQAMLATQLNPCVSSGQLQKGSVVQLMEYICNSVQNRKIIIVLNMEIIIPKCDTLGDPKQFTDSNANANANAQKPQLQQQGAAMPMQSAPQAQAMMPLDQPAHSYGGCSVNTIGSNMNMTGQSMGVGHPRSDFNFPASTASNMSDAGSGLYARPAGGPIQGSAVSGAVVRGMNPLSNPYGRPAVAPSYQPPPMYSSKGPISRNEAPARIIPIAALNPYQGRWTIKARVTAKGDLRRYNNARGDGKVFSFDLLDSDGGEIRVTCFNAVADQFYDRIEIGRVYTISKGSLKPAQKNFNHLKNDYEIFLESSSTVEACLEEDNSIPKQHFNFRPISEVEDIENNSMVDIIGVVMQVNPSTTIMRKNGIETQKRTLQLKDMSCRSVELTMWGGFCNKEGQQLQDICDLGSFPILAVKAGRISDFSGKSVGTITTSQLFINPDLPEAHRLRQWFEMKGKNVASQSITKEFSSGGRAELRKTVTQIKDEGLGRSDKPDWISVRAAISFIKVDNFCYTACPIKVGDRQCNKKVNNNGDGNWHCERCDRSFPECDYRYLLQCQVQDHTGLTWVTAFQEAGEEIMGVTAKELYMLKHEEQDDVKFGEIIRQVLFHQYIFKLKVKEETYSDEQRVKCTVVKTERLDYLSESKFLLDSIAKFSNADFTTVGVERASNPVTSTGSYGMGYNNGGGVGSSSASDYSIPANDVGKNIGGGYFSNSGGYGPQNPSLNMYSSSTSCNRCGQIGHLPSNCPSSGHIPAAYGSGNAGGGYGTRAGGYGGGY